MPEWESARPQWEQELGEQARQQMNEIAQRPWATVNPPLSAATPQSQMMITGANGMSTVPQNSMERSNANSLGSWAAVNQPPPAPGAQGYRNGGDNNGVSFQISMEQAKREETVLDERESAALIDTLPKHKQRQVYGLVSGLQGGIEHLQRELDSLKRALGIDED